MVDEVLYNTLSPYGHLLTILRYVVDAIEPDKIVAYLKQPQQLIVDQIHKDSDHSKKFIRTGLDAMGKYPVTVDGHWVCISYDAEIQDKLCNEKYTWPVAYGAGMVFHSDHVLLEESDDEPKWTLPMGLQASKFGTDPITLAYRGLTRNGIDAFSDIRVVDKGYSSVPIEEQYSTSNMTAARASKMFVLTANLSNSQYTLDATPYRDGRRGFWLPLADVDTYAHKIDPDTLGALLSSAHYNPHNIDQLRELADAPWPTDQPRNIVYLT